MHLDPVPSLTEMHCALLREESANGGCGVLSLVFTKNVQ